MITFILSWFSLLSHSLNIIGLPLINPSTVPVLGSSADATIGKTGGIELTNTLAPTHRLPSKILISSPASISRPMIVAEEISRDILLYPMPE